MPKKKPTTPTRKRPEDYKADVKKALDKIKEENRKNQNQEYGDGS